MNPKTPSLPVASDVRLVTDATQGDAVELSTKSLGNGAPHAGLAHSWRPHEAQNGPLRVERDSVNKETCSVDQDQGWWISNKDLEWSLELPDSQVLQQTPLQLVHGVMVVFKQGSSVCDVQAVWGEGR